MTVPQTRSMTHVECDWCHELATVCISAQWTIFDWDHAYSCPVHVARAIGMFQARHVDGEPVQELTWTSIRVP